ISAFGSGRRRTLRLCSANPRCTCHLLPLPGLYTHLLRGDSGSRKSTMNHLFRYRAVLVFFVVLPLTGCLFRSHKVERQVSTAPLKSATQQELIDYINTQAAKIKSMQATVDI